MVMAIISANVAMGIARQQTQRGGGNLAVSI